MKCNHEVSGELLSAYLDHALNDDERQQVENHLATCEACREELAALKRIRSFLQAVPPRELPSGFSKQLRAALLEQRSSVTSVESSSTIVPSRKRRAYARTRSFGWLAAAILLLVLLPAASLASTWWVAPSRHLLQTDSSPTPEAPAGPMGVLGMGGRPEPSDQRPEFSREASPTQEQTLYLAVEDVQLASEQATALVAGYGARVSEQRHRYDAAGVLLESTLVLQVPADMMDAVKGESQHLGQLLSYEVKDRFDDRDLADKAESRITLRMEPFAIRRMAPESPGVVAEYALHPSWFTQVYRNFVSSWRSFGHTVAVALLWTAGHVPHILFVGTLAALVYWGVSVRSR